FGRFLLPWLAVELRPDVAQGLTALHPFALRNKTAGTARLAAPLQAPPGGRFRPTSSLDRPVTGGAPLRPCAGLGSAHLFHPARANSREQARTEPAMPARSAVRAAATVWRMRRTCTAP